MLKPSETLETVKNAGIAKATASTKKLLLLSFLAGLFIAFAALTSTIVSMNLLKDPTTFGLGKLIQGFTFAGGLIFVVLGGAELFTGNSLMIVAFLHGEITLKQLLRNWGLVYLGNFLGALFLAICVSLSGIFNYNNGFLGATLSSIALSKVSLNFLPALILGILCNILVCLAVWMAFGAKTTAGKILAIVFPVAFFVICGFEHSIANMFYIPAGFLANNVFSLPYLLANLIPVTIGNIIGGGIFIAGFYTFSLKNDKMSLCLSEKTSKNQSKNKNLKPSSKSQLQNSKNLSQKKKSPKTNSSKSKNLTK